MSTSRAPVVSPPVARGLRLGFLDGLRALACLYVLIFHELSAKVTGHGDPSWAMAAILPRLNRGRFGVVFFIVLSGFSLMLPLARASEFHLIGGFRKYIYRRARRIIPPYYAALILSIAVIVVYNRFGAAHDLGPRLDAALKPGSIISHLFLFHNFTFEWAYRINGPMWSVATEWQIYFIFPALLLPLWRLGGGLATVILAWIVGALPFFVLPPDANFFWACPWFIGSFAMGMAAAVIGCDPQRQESPLRNRTPWGMLSAALFVALVAICVLGGADRWPYPVVDLVVSSLAFCVICACMQSFSRGTGGSHAMMVILESRFLVYVGGFSYSLYLVQHPVLRLIEKVCNRLPLSYDENIVLQLAVGTPTVMAVAWLFSELFERPFTRGGILLPAAKRLFNKEAPRAAPL